MEISMSKAGLSDYTSNIDALGDAIKEAVRLGAELREAKYKLKGFEATSASWLLSKKRIMVLENEKDILMEAVEIFNKIIPWLKELDSSEYHHPTLTAVLFELESYAIERMNTIENS